MGQFDRQVFFCYNEDVLRVNDDDEDIILGNFNFLLYLEY